MRKIHIKINNEQMRVLLVYLDENCLDAWAMCNDEDMEHKLSRIMAGTLLYDLSITLAAKYKRYSAQPSFSFSLTRAQAAAFQLYIEHHLMFNPYVIALLNTIISKIDPQL